MPPDDVTPTNPGRPIAVVPVAAPQSGLAQMVSGAVGAFLGSNGSPRRFALALVTGAVIALNAKLALGMDAATLATFASFMAAVIVSSNGKEAISAHADAKVQAAAIFAASPETDAAVAKS